MPPSLQPTSQTLRDLPEGKFTSLTKVKPSGTLQARKQANGAVIFYWRYSIGTTSERVAIGLYDSSASPKSLSATPKGYSIAAATRAAENMAEEHYRHRDRGGRPALLAAQREAVRTAELAKQQADKQTLTHMLADYCDHLETLERVAHRDARSIFKLHVNEAWPAIAALPANAVTGEQIADMMRRLIDLEKGRTANKLRSYLRAAFQMAKGSRSKASVPARFKDYDVKTNPADDTEADATQNRPDKKPLTHVQLQAYWQKIKVIPGFKGAVLRLHLLTGGQRIEQLVKLLTEDIGDDLIVLYDKKGRPGKPPRPNSIPLIPAAQTALLGCAPTGNFAISTDEGNTHLAATTLSHWAVEATSDSKALDGFRAKRIRSGVETILASAGVTADIRGRLQSHGISGVQARHYDGHDYIAEKRQALMTLFGLLEKPSSSNLKKHHGDQKITDA